MGVVLPVTSVLYELPIYPLVQVHVRYCYNCFLGRPRVAECHGLYCHVPALLGMHIPQSIGGRWLVDQGVLSPLPVSRWIHMPCMSFALVV